MVSESSAFGNAEFGTGLKSRQSRIIRLQDVVLQARTATVKLRQSQKRALQDGVAQRRAASWREGMKLYQGPELHLRLPDRQMRVRLYSLLDNDLWMMDPLRAWFNKYNQTAAPREDWDGVREGYLVRAIPQECPPPKEPAKLEVLIKDGRYDGQPRVAGSKYDFRHPSPYHAISELAAQQTQYPVERGPHWMDHEGQVKAQHEISFRKMQERRFYPISEPGHVPGARRTPWKPRPLIDEDTGRAVQHDAKVMQREAYLEKGGGLESYGQIREEARQRKLVMQKGSF